MVVVFPKYTIDTKLYKSRISWFIIYPKQPFLPVFFNAPEKKKRGYRIVAIVGGYGSPRLVA